MEKTLNPSDFDRDYFKHHAYGVYPHKGYICIDGVKYYALKAFKAVDLDTRLSWPPKVFAAIQEA